MKKTTKLENMDNFVVGLGGGGILTFLFVNWSVVYGSLAVGVLFGLLNMYLSKEKK